MALLVGSLCAGPSAIDSAGGVMSEKREQQSTGAKMSDDSKHTQGDQRNCARLEMQADASRGKRERTVMEKARTAHRSERVRDAWREKRTERDAGREARSRQRVAREVRHAGRGRHAASPRRQDKGASEHEAGARTRPQRAHAERKPRRMPTQTATAASKETDPGKHHSKHTPEHDGSRSAGRDRHAEDARPLRRHRHGADHRRATRCAAHNEQVNGDGRKRRQAARGK